MQIKINLSGTGSEHVAWNHLYEDKVVLLAFADTVMNFRTAQTAGNFLTG